MKHPDSNSDNHPEVKVLEELAPLAVASCRVVGPDPEINSRNCLIRWAKESGIPWEVGDARHFGFDNPDTSDPANRNKPHGYESWMTVPRGVKGTQSVEIKAFSGGLYAAAKTTVAEVRQSWQRIVAWLSTSKYSHGDHQWLEEVVAFDFENETDIRLKIMMPIK